MQTRTYPRTTNEAFHKTAEYGCAIEKPSRRTADTAVNVVLCVAIVAVILSICFQGAV